MDERSSWRARSQNSARVSAFVCLFVFNPAADFGSFFCLQPSVFELVRRPDFANLPLVVEDFVKDYGGSYTGEART